MPLVQGPNLSQRIRFGPFELDLQSLELSKSGVRLKLQGQPLKVLGFLLERPGQLVTREELRQHLWPADTFVDFEHSLNTDIRRLREALSDEVETPRYIETLRGRGYRFVGKLEQENVVQAEPAVNVALPTAIQAEPQNRRDRRSRLRPALALLGLLIPVLVGLVYVFKPPSPVTIGATRRITRTPYKKAHRVPVPIVSDGARIYFREYRNGAWQISQISTTGGEVSALPTSYMEIPFLQDISPDASELLIVEYKHGEGPRLWLVPLPSGPARRIPNIRSWWALFERHGRGILYSANADKDLYKAEKDGSKPRRLLSVPNPLGGPIVACPQVSPDVAQLRYTVFWDMQSTPTIWEVGLDGSNVHPLFVNQEVPTRCGVWSPDGQLYAFHRWDGSRWNLWTVRETSNKIGPHRRQEPAQLTFGPLSYESSTFSRDSKTLYALGIDPRGELAAYTQNSGQSTPYLQGISASYAAFSRDGQWVAYVAYPEGTLWRSRIDGSERRQLTFPPLKAMLPRWSPDAKMIVFASMPGVGGMLGGPGSIYVVPADGGNPMLVVGEGFNDPTWSPDGASIAYAGCLKGTDECPGESVVRILDLKTMRSRTIPGSTDFFSPRWSPDGKHLVVLGGDAHVLWLYRFASNDWIKLASDQNHYYGWPEWSPDSRYVYVSGGNEDIIRINIANRRTELALRIKDIPRTGWWGNWFGITGDGKILLLRSTGSEDLYAFDLKDR
jgi:DNA-binding winged helix-turn-helix (wHTH) protein/Tol biopolymer transport system component